LPICELRLASNATAKPFGHAMRASSLLELIHFNICGSMNVKAHHRTTYFVTRIDDYHGYVYLLCHRHETLDVFEGFISKMKTQLEWRVKTLWSARACEYLSDVFKEFREGKGI